MADFSSLMQVWFRQSQRNLPWRGTNNPYKIWLSEIILQQTKVKQGLNYYLKFVKTFPKVEDLANASEDKVLKLWQGLGYYSRARNMHASAKMIVHDFGGVFPKTYKEVLSLKGVGEYTAAAICSIAYGLPHAVVDGNVYRVLSRYLEIETPIDTSQGKKLFTKIAQELLDCEHPSDHNQAMMELGALVCLPKKPACETCPINMSCAANKNKTQLNFPVKSKKTKVVNRFFNFLVITNGKQIIIKKRTGKGIWMGLYDFPNIEKQNKEVIHLGELNFSDIHDFQFDGTFKHVLSHQIISASFWIVTLKNLPLEKGQIVIDINDVEKYPLPQLLVRYLKSSSYFDGEK